MTRKINVLDAIKEITQYLSLRAKSDEVAKVYTDLIADDDVILIERSGKESRPYKDGVCTQEVWVRIEHDYDAHDPSAAGGDDGCWRIWTFNRDLTSFKDPEELGFTVDGGCDDDELAKKLASGLAFQLGCYEHGETSWFIQGEGGPGSDCQWDGTSFAGVAIWEEDESNMGATTYEDRKKDCAGCLEAYTAWGNGDCYGFIVEDANGEGESCWGFYGGDENLKCMFLEIQEMTEGKVVLGVTGDAKDLADHHDVQKKPEVKVE